MRVLMARSLWKQYKWWIVLLLQGKSPSPYPSRLVYFSNPSMHTHTHTQQQGSELFANMCCLHYWTEQQQTQSRDSQDNPPHCIPRSLVPQCCRTGTHTSGTSGVMWKQPAPCRWLVGWVDWCLQIPDRRVDRFSCLAVGAYVNVYICVCRWAACLPSWLSG